MSSGDRAFKIGRNAQVDDDVVLGYRYPGQKHPLVIGDDAIIRSGTIIYSDCTIGHRFSCGHQVLIRAHTTIGNRVVIHHKCTLEGRVRIGKGVKIMAHVYIPSTTEIGNMVFIGPGTVFLNDRYPMRRRDGFGGARIEDHVTIGGSVTVGPGITVGRGALVGAGALLNKDVPPGMLAYGVPARFYPLPERIPPENQPELLLPQTDLWGPQQDESWRQE